MALKCGIVGLPNVGKSTLFNCLSNAKAQSANFPFCTIEPNVGVIPVPDVRIQRLVELCKPRSVVPATVEIVDIAGLVKGASKGEGLGNKFLANIRETDAILHVVRCFDDDNIVHVDGSVDPVRDIEVINTELQLKDLETVEARMAKAEKAARSGDKTARALMAVLEPVRQALLQGRSARTAEPEGDDDRRLFRELMLLTAKPVLYVCNVDEGAAAEADIAELDTEEERAEFLEALGLESSGVARLIRAAYALLGLRTYFTAGPDEVRAWTFRRGTRAPQAAGIIHTDFERGFIRANVIKYDDYVSFGSEAAVRDAGRLSVEGKDYEVQDGDVMHFLFNV